jgi:hypothetical protein
MKDCEEQADERRYFPQFGGGVREYGKCLDTE